VKVCRVSPRQTRPLCFGKRAENHSRPCTAPLGKLRHDTKLYGCATRGACPEPCRRTQTVLAREVEFGAMAKPRPRRLPHWPVHGFERTRFVFPLLPITLSTVIPTKVGIQVGIFQRYAGRHPAQVRKRKTWMPVPRFREDKLHGQDEFAL